MPISPKSNTSSDFARTEIELADLAAKVNKIATAQAQGTGTGATAQIGICSPNFIISSVQSKKGERDVMCLDPIPSASDRIRIVIGQTADSTTRNATITKTVNVDSLAAQAHHLEVEFPHELFYNTQYGLIKLKAMDIDGTVIATNPGSDPWNGTQYTYITTWTTGNALNAPSAPDCRLDPTGTNGLIISNIISSDADGNIGAVTFRIYADPTKTKTFDQQQAIRAIGYFNPVLGGTVDTHTIHIPATIQDTTQKFIDIQGQFVLGQTVQWTQNALAHGTGKSFSATSTCTFIAGGVNTDSTAFANMVNAATLSFVAIDGKHSKVTLTYLQPATPFAIKKVQLLRSDDGGVTYSVEVPADRPISDGTVSSGTKTAVYLVKTKVATNSLWQVHMLARPGLNATGPAITGTGALADPTGDSGAATGVQNLALFWTAKKGFKATWQRPATNRASIQYYNVYFDNGFPVGNPSRAFMAAFDGQQSGVLAGQDITVFGQAGATFQVKGTEWTTHQRLANTAAAFAPHGGCCVHVVPVNLVNGVETAGTEAIACLAFATLGTTDNITSTDAVNVIDVSTTLWSPTQLIPNGDFLYSDGAGNVNFWQANGNVINTGTSPATWSPSSHTLTLTGNGTLTVAQRKHLVPGDVFSISFLISGSGSGTMTLNISDIGVTQQPVISITANANQVLYGGPVTMNSSNTGNNQFVQLIWSTSGTWTLDRVMMSRGKQPVSFMPRTAAFEGDASSFANENPFNPSVAAATQQDLSTPTGSNPAQGRYFPPGQGGFIPIL